jgi:hypothetical protein
MNFTSWPRNAPLISMVPNAMRRSPDSGYQIGDAGYPDFFDFLAKVALNVWDDDEEIEQEEEGGA